MPSREDLAKALIDFAKTAEKGQEDFLFSVTDDHDLTWDVYAFVKEGSKGTLAFARYPSGQWRIGVFTLGRLDREQVLDQLRLNNS